jgi:hypothetical protein
MQMMCAAEPRTAGRPACIGEPSGLPRSVIRQVHVIALPARVVLASIVTHNGRDASNDSLAGNML